MELREYQLKAIKSIREQISYGKNRIVVCAPTGSGKTVIFSEISKLAFYAGNSILIITNRKELCSQTNNKLNQFGIMPEILNAKNKEKPTHKVVVSMVETLNRRLNNIDYYGFIQAFSVIIIDECHIHCFDKLFENITLKQRVLGFSATPYRKSQEKPLKNYYDSIINVCQVSELISLGFLSKPVTYGVPISLKCVKMKGGDYDEQELGKIYDDKVKYVGAISNYEKYAKNQKTIVFCATIENSNTISQMFVESGFKSRHFDCYMSDKERGEVLNWFSATADAILCNVGILTTGFDCPDIKCVLIYRATKSLPLFLQMVGRGSRVCQGKESFIILDFGNNISEHGFWEQDREWNLEPPKKREKKTDVETIKECPQCQAYISINWKICPECGYEYISKSEPKKEIEILLENLLPSDVQRLANSGTLTVSELEEVRILKGYKVGWVLHKLTEFNQYKEYEKIKGYKRGWADWQWKNKVPKEEVKEEVKVKPTISLKSLIDSVVNKYPENNE